VSFGAPSISAVPSGTVPSAAAPSQATSPAGAPAPPAANSPGATGSSSPAPGRLLRSEPFASVAYQIWPGPVSSAANQALIGLTISVHKRGIGLAVAAAARGQGASATHPYRGGLRVYVVEAASRTVATALAVEWAPLAARVLLGLVFGWFGYHELVQPALWTGYVPGLSPASSVAVLAVLAHGWMLLMLAVALMAGIATRLTAGIAAITLLEIVVSLTVTAATGCPVGRCSATECDAGPAGVLLQARS
jgi:uncharacterized membrane protein YphA (DoxX/SURF4 family)